MIKKMIFSLKTNKKKLQISISKIYLFFFFKKKTIKKIALNMQI